jgi:serine/threonine protein kinase
VLKTEVKSAGCSGELQPEQTADGVLPAEIVGYRLEHRLGVGGFGEVWRGIGPGGFAKAIKILYGSVSGTQAETELKSLHRIRELRHPFLLNVERVEVSDGRLVIVTELADRSLDARFREATDSGLKGIPRDELLGYLRDAADALDFMAEQYGLQHLDIKPENLLLQGNHAKVGDFGLTKSLDAVGNSLVNGFTPLYAPPEVFDGRPDLGSDQYSLAIVYQTMLTGVAPFNGRTSAQLMAQHLKGTPELGPLHPADRAVVARALSRNPRNRFRSCRQFIDELAKRRITGASLPRTSEPTESARISSLTQVAVEGGPGTRRSQLLPPASPLTPPEKIDRVTPYVQPTVFIAVGGLGIRAAEILREQLSIQYPDASLPLLHFLFLDSDSFSNITGSNVTARTVTCEDFPTECRMVHLPLRSSHEYRKTSAEHLNWLSRRWLFNIPRSGNVDGMRPLGRLALVDNVRHVTQALDEILETALCPESAHIMQNQIQQPCSVDGIEFVLIGSTAGGTASGSLLDIAWLVRSVVAERRMPPSSVSAMLIHGTAHNRQAADMQDANTISFLKELQHFSLPGVDRPGLTSRNSSLASTGRPFNSAWFFHMGDDLSSLDYQNRLQAVARYLQLRSLTLARPEMKTWSMHAADHSLETELQLRTFGLATIASDAWCTAHSEAIPLCRAALRHWSSAGRIAPIYGDFSDADPQTSALIAQLSLTSEGVIDLVPRLFNIERSRRVDDYAAVIHSRIPSDTKPADLPACAAAAITVDSGSGGRNWIATILEEIRRDLASSFNQNIVAVETLIGSLLDGRGRVAAAEDSIRILIHAADEAIENNGNQQSDLQQAFSDLCENITNSAGSQTDTSVPFQAIKAFCRQYCMLIACQTVCESIASSLKQLRESLNRIRIEQIHGIRQRCEKAIDMLGPVTLEQSAIPATVALAFEEAVLASHQLRLSDFCLRDFGTPEITLLKSLAANFLFSGVNHSGQALPAATAGETESFPASARPFLRNVGGGQRVLAAIPEMAPLDHWKNTLQKHYGACVSLCPMPGSDVNVVCETEGISISTVLNTLSQHKPSITEMAARVHSRQDIPW